MVEQWWRSTQVCPVWPWVIFIVIERGSWRQYICPQGKYIKYKINDFSVYRIRIRVGSCLLLYKLWKTLPTNAIEQIHFSWRDNRPNFQCRGRISMSPPCPGIILFDCPDILILVGLTLIWLPIFPFHFWYIQWWVCIYDNEAHLRSLRVTLAIRNNGLHKSERPLPRFRPDLKCPSYTIKPEFKHVRNFMAFSWIKKS